MDETIQEFTPDGFRYFAWQLLQLEGGLFIVVLISIVESILGSKIHLEVLPPVALMILAVWAIASMYTLADTQRRHAITISDEDVAGPSLVFARPIHFPLHALDKTQSCKRNFLQKLLGYMVFVSTTGEKIYFCKRTFDKNEVEAILKALGCSRTDIA